MLRLHYYSNFAGLRLATIAEESEDDVYRIDQIKEFEAVSQAWKETLAEYLLKGIIIPWHNQPPHCIESIYLNCIRHLKLEHPILDLFRRIRIITVCCNSI